MLPRIFAIRSSPTCQRTDASAVRGGSLHPCGKWALLLAVVLMGCGGKTGAIPLNIVVSPIDDPFIDATSVRFSVVGTSESSTVAVADGHFEFSHTLKPSHTFAPILVEVLDRDGQVFARGLTPALSQEAMSRDPVAVWVGRVGQVAPSGATLPFGRTEVAAASVVGLGAVYAGGKDQNRVGSSATAVFDVFTQTVLQTAAMNSVRTGAVAVGNGNVQAVVFGGMDHAGMPLATSELFDPRTGLGSWVAVPSDTLTARSRPNLTLLKSGTALLSGGANAAGEAIGTAALLATSGTVRLSAIASPMVAPRLGHAVAPATFPDGDGAVLFGGLAPGSTFPIAERLIGQSFTAYDVALPNRTGATATALPSGAILLLGGTGDDGLALPSGALIIPSVPPTVTPIESALSSARVGHTATLLGTDVLVCGGANATGEVLATCDLVKGPTYDLRETIPLPAARRDHTAVTLETGVVLLAGGAAANGEPLASMDIYTPR
jgi:hypothetical protein